MCQHDITEIRSNTQDISIYCLECNKIIDSEPIQKVFQALYAKEPNQ